MKKLLISVVCFNNDDEVLKFANLLSKQKNSNSLVLIVTCNKVRDFSSLTNQMKKIKLETYIYDLNENVGYLPGLLYGFNRYISEVNCDFDWILMSNTDITFDSSDFFEKFINAEIDLNTWCVGPDIILTRCGKHQNPFLIKRPSRKKIYLWIFVNSNIFMHNFYHFLSKIKSKFVKKHGNLSDCVSNVYSVHGCSFFIRKELAKDLFSLKEKTFMYGEELLISENVLKNNKEILYFPKISLHHNENQVTGKVNNLRKMKWSKKSIMLIYNNYFKK